MLRTGFLQRGQFIALAPLLLVESGDARLGFGQTRARLRGVLLPLQQLPPTLAQLRLEPLHLLGLRLRYTGGGELLLQRLPALVLLPDEEGELLALRPQHFDLAGQLVTPARKHGSPFFVHGGAPLEVAPIILQAAPGFQPAGDIGAALLDGAGERAHRLFAGL